MKTKGKTGVVTLADVARAAGVSLTTASQALSGKERVSPRTRQEVSRIAESLGYSGNPLAKALRGGFDERKVALFSTELDLGVRTQRLRDIQNRLRSEGYIASLFVSEEPENQIAVFESLCRQRPRAILLNAPPFQVAPESLALLEAYQQSGGILIAYPRAFPLDCDQVTTEFPQDVRLAIGHLLQAGHRRIGVRSHGSRNDVLEATFAAEMRAVGLTADPVWMCYEGFYEEGGLRLAERFLSAPPETRPTGFFIINDVSAAAFVAVLARQGVRVPQDVSVLGYDDTPAAWCGLVPLTTINTNSDRIVEEVLSLFLSRVRGEYAGPARRVETLGRFIERESVGPPPR